VHPHRRRADTDPVRLVLADAPEGARVELVPISHRLATSILVGDLSGLRAGSGWPSAELRHRLRASAIDGVPAGWLVVVDGVVGGDRADPRARVAHGGRRLTVAV